MFGTKSRQSSSAPNVSPINYVEGANQWTTTNSVQEEINIDDIMKQFDQLQLNDPETAEKICIQTGFESTGSTCVGSDYSLTKCPEHLQAHDIDEGSEDCEMQDYSQKPSTHEMMQKWMMRHYMRSLLEKTDQLTKSYFAKILT